MIKYYTLKDTITNSYVSAIMINGVVFFYPKPTVYSTKKVMEKLREKIYTKYPDSKGRLILEEDYGKR